MFVVGRTIVFLLKVYSVLAPCAPYTADPWIAYPLLGLAALDFTVDSCAKHGKETTGVLLLVHVVIVIAAQRQAILCPARQEDRDNLWSG